VHEGRAVGVESGVGGPVGGHDIAGRSPHGLSVRVWCTEGR
jgi:hypothetical protein